MAKIAVIKSGTNDEWKVFTKKDGTFHKALLNDERMIEKENKKDGEKIDLNSVEDDFDAFDLANQRENAHHLIKGALLPNRIVDLRVRSIE